MDRMTRTAILRCTARSCIADGDFCQNFFICRRLGIKEKVVDRCKDQHLSWKGIVACILLVLVGSISL